MKAYAERDIAIEQIVAEGFDHDIVVRTAYMVDGSEYKHRQAAPGIRITPRGFGRDRRLPITSKFREE